MPTHWEDSSSWDFYLERLWGGGNSGLGWVFSSRVFCSDPSYMAKPALIKDAREPACVCACECSHASLFLGLSSENSGCTGFLPAPECPLEIFIEPLGSTGSRKPNPTNICEIACVRGLLLAPGEVGWRVGIPAAQHAGFAIKEAFPFLSHDSGKVIDVSKPQFLDLCNGVSNSIYLQTVL